MSIWAYNGICIDGAALQGTRGVLWQQELYEGFTYNQDRAYFFTFEGDVSLLLLFPMPFD
jgi:WH1 domain